MEPPILIAHRGYAKRYPENTLVSIEAALKAGANYVEFDVQLTSDGVPVVLHDANLKRTTGVNKRIINIEFAQLDNIVVNEAKKHPKKFADVGIPSLESMIQLLGKWPKARAFVEIKQESIDAFGIEKAIRTLVKTCKPIIDRCILIAYDDLALRCSRAMGFKSVGWILKKYNNEHLLIATKLAPDYLICNYTKIPENATSLWKGPWEWAFYELTDTKVAYDLVKLGAKYVETMAVAELLKGIQKQSRKRIVDEVL